MFGVAPFGEVKHRVDRRQSGVSGADAVCPVVFEVVERIDAATQNLEVWKVVSHTRERRYAYDAVGHMTDALDVFLNGPTLAQSGQRKIYNAFGEVTGEQIVWGAASDALTGLHHATRRRNSYDNAGNLVMQDGADGRTQFFYNLTGQITRAEQRGDNSAADGTHTRVGETGYDLMGRTAWQSNPVFEHKYRGGMVTPVTNLSFDRWGNVTRRTEVGNLGNGLAASIRNTFYEYNADNKVISAELGFARALRGDGSSYATRRHASHALRLGWPCGGANRCRQRRLTLPGRTPEHAAHAQHYLILTASGR